jgi:hypothetical protein
MDDKRYILSLINEGEHQQQDFKYRVSDAWKTSWPRQFTLPCGANRKSPKAA